MHVLFSSWHMSIFGSVIYPADLDGPFRSLNLKSNKNIKVFSFLFFFLLFIGFLCLWRSRNWQCQKLNFWIHPQSRYIPDRCSHSQTALPMTLTLIWKDNSIYYKEERWFSLQPCWQSLGPLWTQFVICAETSNHLIMWTISHQRLNWD